MKFKDGDCGICLKSFSKFKQGEILKIITIYISSGGEDYMCLESKRYINGHGGNTIPENLIANYGHRWNLPYKDYKNYLKKIKTNMRG